MHTNKGVIAKKEYSRTFYKKNIELIGKIHEKHLEYFKNMELNAKEI